MKKLHIMESPLLHGKPDDAPLVHVVWKPDEYAYWAKGERGELIIFKHTGRVFSTRETGGTEIVEAKPCYIVEPGMYFKVWDEDEEPVPPHNFLTYHKGQWITDDGHVWTENDELSYQLRDTPVQVDPIVPSYDEPDFAIERAQPGQDGLGIDESVLVGEVTVVSAEGTCPSCGSYKPSLHPAIQSEGEVSYICQDVFHGRKVEITEDDVQGGLEVINYMGRPGYVEPDNQKTQVISDPLVTRHLVIDVESSKRIEDVKSRPPKTLDWGTLHAPLVVPEQISFFDDQPTDGNTEKE